MSINLISCSALIEWVNKEGQLLGGASFFAPIGPTRAWAIVVQVIVGVLRQQVRLIRRSFSRAARRLLLRVDFWVRLVFVTFAVADEFGDEKQQVKEDDDCKAE